MLVYKFVKLFYFSFICSFVFCDSLFSSMSVCGDVSDTLVSLMLPVASGTSVTHSAIALCTPIFLSYHILMSSVIYHQTNARQHGTYLLNALSNGTIHRKSNVYLI